MSTPLRRGLPTVVASLTLGLCLAVPAAGQDDRDLLKEAQQRRAVEAQRVEKEFATGRLFAYNLVRKDPDRLVEAVERLVTLQALLERDQSLEPARREVLLVTIKKDVSDLTASARRARAARTIEAVGRETHRDLRQGQAGRGDPEGRQREREVRSVFDARRQAVADARALRGQQGDRFLGVQRGLDRSSIPPASDYDLPADWVEKSKRRSPLAKLTAEEKALLEALQKPVSVEFDGEPLQGVLDALQKLSGQTITVDRQALMEVGASYEESKVTVRLRRTTLRTVLKRILNDLGLTYVIKNGTLYVTSVARAREMVTTRVYYIGDLLGVTSYAFNPLNRLQAVQAVNTILSMVTGIEPQTWRVNNPDAPGTVTFDPVNMSLIVRQSAEVHFMLGSLRR